MNKTEAKIIAESLRTDELSEGKAAALALAGTLVLGGAGITSHDANHDNAKAHLETQKAFTSAKKEVNPFVDPVKFRKAMEKAKKLSEELTYMIENKSSAKWMVYAVGHEHGLIVEGKTAARALLKHLHAAGHKNMVMAPCGRGGKPVKSKVLHEKFTEFDAARELRAGAEDHNYAKPSSELVKQVHNPLRAPDGMHFRVTHPGGKITHHIPSDTDHKEIMSHIQSGKRVEHFNPETKKYSVLSAGRVGK